jgi:uncharacterized membrane protein
MLSREAQVTGADPKQLRLRVIPTVKPILLHDAGEGAKPLGRNRDDQPVFAVEMMRWGCVRDPGFRRGAAQGQPVDAILVQQVKTGGDQCRAQIAMMVRFLGHLCLINFHLDSVKFTGIFTLSSSREFRMIAIVSKSLFWLLCIAIALVTLRVFPLGLQAAFGGMERQFAHLFPFWTHIMAASLALLVMPFQFWTKLRIRRPGVHRWIGRTYVLAVLLGGVSGMLMATRTITGPASGIGFFILAALWLTITAIALYHAVNRNIETHKRWMIRSAALTFAAVTLRVYLGLSQVAGLPFDPSYTVIAWACWVPNLLVAEWWLRRRSPQTRPVTP